MTPSWRVSADGTIDAICSDHAPIGDDDKQLPFSEAAPGATALETLLPLTLKWASENKVSLVKALARVTSRPAEILGEDTGRLTVGAKADIVVFDPQAHWRVTPDVLKSAARTRRSPATNCWGARATRWSAATTPRRLGPR